LLIKEFNSEEVSFVHHSLPDLSLKEIDTTFFIDNNLKVAVPIFVLASDDKIAYKLSEETNAPVIVDGKDWINIYVNNRKDPLKIDFKKIIFAKVKDGVEAAKAIRNSMIPIITEAQIKDLPLYITQLKIAMFLTNSKNIEELKHAPIYLMG